MKQDKVVSMSKHHAIKVNIESGQLYALATVPWEQFFQYLKDWRMDGPTELV
jgi:hypothetical protein